LLFAGKNPQPVEVQMILTSVDHMNRSPPVPKPGDITITDATITDWVPFEGGRDLDPFILIDDSADYDFGARLQELKRFVTSRPASASIGVAYIHDGALRIVMNPTTDISWPSAFQAATDAIRIHWVPSWPGPWRPLGAVVWW
jgi:hypothetical protein